MFEDQGFDEGTYDTAQICENGHVITDAVQDFAAHGRNFCEVCGARTITACPHCGNAIRGHLRGVVSMGNREAPLFCGECGKAYPWTSRRIQAAKTMADELSELGDSDRLLLKASIDDIAADTPMTQVAVIRFKKLLSKMTRESAGAMRRLVVDVAGKTAAEMLKGG